MNSRNNFVDKTFGKLIAIAPTDKRSDGRVVWHCKCECGNDAYVRSNNLKSGNTKSCGHCYSIKYILLQDKNIMVAKATNGKNFLFDSDEYTLIKSHIWWFDRYGYPFTRINKVYISLHRFILSIPENICIDHINQDKSDCRKANLRPADKQKNSANVGIKKNNTSGAKGVSIIKRTGRFKAVIGVNGKQIYLGRFHTLVEAARAYDLAAVQHFAEFACINNL